MQTCKIKAPLLKRVAQSYQIVRFRRTLPGRRKHAWPKDDRKDRFIVPAPLDSPLNYTETPQYPPIVDTSDLGRRRRDREDWYQEMKDLNTVEEKLIKLNMPKYYGWNSYNIREGELPYDPLPYAQFLTRTHVVPNYVLPIRYENVVSQETLDQQAKCIEMQVKDLLLLEHEYKHQNHQFTQEELEDEKLKENRIAKNISENMHRIMLGNLSLENPHLIESQVDYDPRIEAFWFQGGIPPTTHVIKSRLGSWAKAFAMDPIDRGFHYYGSPMFQVRHNLPLPEILPMEECNDLDVPEVRMRPEPQGYFDAPKHANEIPGFWPGDRNEFGLMSYHSRGHLIGRAEMYIDEIDALTAQAVFGNYGWLLSQACFQGFSTFNDVTYPLVNQMVITSGKEWSFCVYQLNTTTHNIDRIDENPKRNICWITKPMKLFETVENGQVVGYNDEVVKNLIKFYSNAPAERVGIEMKPYLQKEQLVKNIEHEDKRIWLEHRYKQMTANRKRHKLVPEIYAWQRIYIIDHKMRSIDKKWERWEKGINMFNRRLCDHQPPYIPKALRPDPRNKKKGKWARTYYPLRPKDIPVTYQKNTTYTKIPNQYYKGDRGKNVGYLEWFRTGEGARVLLEENKGVRDDEE